MLGTWLTVIAVLAAQVLIVYGFLKLQGSIAFRVGVVVFLEALFALALVAAQ